MMPIELTAQDPSTSKATLEAIWEVAPEAVLLNPVLPLLLLEDPSWPVPRLAARLAAVHRYWEEHPGLAHSLPEWAQRTISGSGAVIGGGGSTGTNPKGDGDGDRYGEYGTSIDITGHCVGHGYGIPPYYDPKDPSTY